MDFNSSNLACNKSFSAPDISNTGPLFRRVVIEEQYYSHNQKSMQYVASQAYEQNSTFLTSLPTGSSSLPIRTYSCDQLPSIEPNGFGKTLHLSPTSTSTPMRHMLILPDSPMEVDLTESINKTVKTEHETTATEKQQTNILDFVDLTFQGSTPVLKKRHINQVKSTMPSKNHKPSITSILNLKNSEKPKPSNLKRLFSKVNIAIFVAALLSIPIYDRLNYNREIDLEDFNDELITSLVGQRDAIKHLTQALVNFKNSSTTPETHLVSLVGTTGVGKTLCVNIIKRKFMPKQIVEIDIESFDLSTYTDFLNFYKSVPYLLILDNIRYKNIQNVIQILNSLPENKWILAVVVFNIQETEDIRTFHVNEELYDLIPNELGKLGYKMHPVNFHRFHADFIQHHVNGFRQVYSDIVDKIPNWKSFVSQHNFDTLGFKGLFEKMNVYAK